MAWRSLSLFRQGDMGLSVAAAMMFCVVLQAHYRDFILLADGKKGKTWIEHLTREANLPLQ